MIQIQVDPYLLKEVHFTGVKKYASLAKKDRVSISETKNTRWFEFFLESEPIGCCGLLYQGRKSRIKGVYILPQHRGAGHGVFMDDCLLSISKSDGVDFVEVLTLHPKFYQNRGFTIIKEANKGVFLAKKSYEEL